MSRSLAANGDSLFVVGRDPDRTEQLADELGALYATCDATNGDDPSANANGRLYNKISHAKDVFTKAADCYSKST